MDGIKRDFSDLSLSNRAIFEHLNGMRGAYIFGEIEEEISRIKKLVESIITPFAAAVLEEEYGYGIVSLGREIEERISELQAKGSFSEAMLVDGIANAYLFEIDRLFGMEVARYCKEQERGIEKRLEAPEQIPMEMQRQAFEAIKKQYEVPVTLNHRLMFEPVKTLCCVWKLTKDSDVCQVEHRCEECQNKNCSHHPGQDKVEICIQDLSGRQHQILVETGKNLLVLLRELQEENSDFYIPATCSGRGSCGKCQVLIGKEEQVQLACMVQIQEPMQVKLFVPGEEEFEIRGLDWQEDAAKERETDLGIAIDLGTTTIAMALIGLESGQVYQTYTGVNHQRRYGADVISRIQASNEGMLRKLQQLIRKDLLRGIGTLQESLKNEERISQIAIAGNTTMIHLLMGYSCKTLGVYPFVPVNTDLQVLPFEGVFNSRQLLAEVHLLPGISAFVGGDITAGILACNMTQGKEVSMLIDLGTNAEMAIGNRDSLLVTSAAAGPAFEGGNISCGVGSVPGAISTVNMVNHILRFETIGGKPMVGLCGTGVVELVSELKEEGIMNTDGLLSDTASGQRIVLGQDPEGNEISFTQKDIRELQLAKAAIRGGMEALIHQYGINKEEISACYLAGGFGYKINVEKAAKIGLLIPELRNRTKAIGNGSLEGCISYLTKESSRIQIQEIQKMGREHSLAKDSFFQEKYIENMSFE